MDTTTELVWPSPSRPAAPFVRPSIVTYKKRTYVNGQFDRNLVWTEFSNLRVAGILAEEDPVDVAVGVGTGITAVSIRYAYTMAEKIGLVVVHESDLSEASDPINLTNQAAAISVLPTSHDNGRVNYKRLYRSDNGADYRHVADIVLATSTYTDTTPTLSLGALAPEGHGVPPYTKFNEIFHDRMFYAGDPDEPQRVYYSALGKPEAVAGLSYIDTRDGEAVTGLKRSGNELIVFCAQVAYSIQGFTESDFVMRKISPSVGCISHHSIVNIDEVLMFASETCVWSYNGSFKNQMEDMETYWRDDYAANTALYQDSVAVDDRYHRGYKLLIPKNNAFYYFGHYRPMQRGEQPYWVLDSRTRKDMSVGRLSPAGGFRADQFCGSADGYIREENIATDASDDSDTGLKALRIQTGAILASDPGGDIQDGKHWAKFWSYVQSESTAWTFYALGGEEDVVSAITPDNSAGSVNWKDDVAAGAISGKTARGCKEHGGTERVSGRALQIRIAANSPLSFKYRGFGGIYGPGPATRPPSA